MVKRNILILLRFPWGKIIGKTAGSAYRHECTDAAAAMAFDLVFAIFPCLLVLTALMVITGTPPDAFNQLIVELGIIIPLPLLAILEENLQHLWESYQSLFFFGILGVLGPASASMSTTMSALNRAYNVVEKRSFWRRRLLSLILVISMGSALVILFNLFVFGEQIVFWMGANWAFLDIMPALGNVLYNFGGFGGTLIVVASIYRLAPNIRQCWKDVLPGSFLFLFLWSFIAGGFRFFIQSFSYYNVVYGVLGGVIILLLCAYLVAFTLLLGGELNGAILEQRQRENNGNARAC